MGNRFDRFAVIFIFILFLLLLIPAEARADQGQPPDEIYDSLNEKIKNNFYEGLESVEGQTDSPIEISGDLPERIVRSLADILYRNLDEIKAYSLILGTLSFTGGLVVFKAVRLDKGMRRYALSVFVITIPLSLFLFVIGISIFIDIFIA